MRVIVVCLSLLCPLAPAQTPTPVITSAEDGWDFGVREQGETEVKRITIRNEGDADLVIESVKITCGCVTGGMERKLIEPGGSADLVKTLRTAGQIGKIRKYAYVRSNDPKTPNLILWINGEVRGRWAVSSVNLLFRTEAGKSQEQKLKVTLRKGERVRLRRIHSKSSHVKIDSEEVRDESGGITGYDVTVTLLGNCPPGNISAIVRIETNDTQTPFRNVAVHAVIKGAARVKPSRLYVGRVFQGRKKTALLKVTHADGKEFEVTGVSSDLDFVKAHVMEVDPKREFDVLVTVAPDDSVTDIVGHVKIETTIEGCETMTVDLEGRAAPPR